MTNRAITHVHVFTVSRRNSAAFLDLTEETPGAGGKLAIRNPLPQGASKVADLSEKPKKVIFGCKKRVLAGTSKAGMAKQIEEEPIHGF